MPLQLQTCLGGKKKENICFEEKQIWKNKNNTPKPSKRKHAKYKNKNDDGQRSFGREKKEKKIGR